METDGGFNYYWLTFSSRRGAGGLPLVYVAAVVTSGSGAGESIEAHYPAVLLPGQDAMVHNYQPTWSP